MKKITVKQIMAWGPCAEYPDSRVQELIGRGKTPFEILGLNIPLQDRLWVLLHKEIVPESLLHLLSCDFAEMVVHLNPDSRVQAAITAKRNWIDGKVTDEKLDAAWDSASDAVWDACVACAASDDAAWAANDDAWDSASDDAWDACVACAASDDAAWAASDDARAAWAAAWAARAAAWAARDAAARVAAGAARDAAWAARAAVSDAAWAAWAARDAAARVAAGAASDAVSAAKIKIEKKQIKLVKKVLEKLYGKN